MKKAILILMMGSVALIGCQSSTQTEETSDEESYFHDGIQWSGENETANYLSSQAMSHWVNIEFDRAYTLWEKAAEVDPTLFGAHTMLAMMSRGETSAMHTRLAKEHVADKNETSKVFVSLLDAKSGEENRAIWAKMHELSNGPFIHYMYARTLGSADDASAMLAELENVISVCNEQGIMSIEAASYNMKAYGLQRSGDMEGASAAADKYLELWDGYNALDSRAEMYLFSGDTTNAVAWYKKVVEKNPFATAAWEHIDELEPEEADATEE